MRKARALGGIAMSVWMTCIVGCLPPAPPPAPPVFSCVGEPNGDDADDRLPPVTPHGRVTVTRSGEPVEGPMFDQRVNIIADGALVGTLAVAIAEALGVSAIIDSTTPRVRVWLVLNNAPLARIAKVLREQHSVLVQQDGDALAFASERSALVGGGAGAAVQPSDLRILNAPAGTGAAQLADLICREVASERGWATAVGRKVVYKDTTVRLDRAANLIDKLRHSGEAR